MSKDEAALRKNAEQAQKRLDEARDAYKTRGTDANGRKLQKARTDASEAWAALWDAVPDEKPPSQQVM